MHYTKDLKNEPSKHSNMNENRLSKRNNGAALMSALCRAQGTFDYGQNELSAGKLAASNPLRSLVEVASTRSADSNVFPTAPSSFTGITGTFTSPTSPFARFPLAGQGQRTVASVPSTSISKRPTSPLATRPTSAIAIAGQEPRNIYGGNLGQLSVTGGGRESGASATDYDGDYSAIPGVPVVNYPIYAQIPETNFDCAQQALPGYYADIEAQCQVFHICALNRTYSFLCPNGTIFSQEVLVCVWWNQYDCNISPSLYANNAFIYNYGPEGIPTNSGYQGANSAQIPRSQTSVLSGNGGRVPAANAAGIFGARSNIPAPGNIALQSSVLSPTTNYNPATSTNSGRFGVAPIGRIGAQIFSAAVPSTIAGIPRTGNTQNIAGVTTTNYGGAGSATVQKQNPFTGLTAATNNNNQEYLPPSN